MERTKIVSAFGTEQTVHCAGELRLLCYLKFMFFN
jgi:hypothetical protein